MIDAHGELLQLCITSLVNSWLRHQMETFSALLAICTGNSPVTGEFPEQSPVTRSFDAFIDRRLNKRLSKRWWGWWFETPLCPLWCHCNVLFADCPLDVVVNDKKVYDRDRLGYFIRDRTPIFTRTECLPGDVNLCDNCVFPHLHRLNRYDIGNDNTNGMCWIECPTIRSDINQHQITQ